MVCESLKEKQLVCSTSALDEKWHNQVETLSKLAAWYAVIREYYKVTCYYPQLLLFQTPDSHAWKQVLTYWPQV